MSSELSCNHYLLRNENLKLESKKDSLDQIGYCEIL